ncbi:malto-oligosyltrehalose trehalohydrolase [Ruixingdingia sedimenti]|uniref:Malto-oligosyltrehalose trehalohydrolase n=1 Tax=Ruixingdingia sedimenti TaxID=3073604 RepID=A0ABU1FCT7_9RHOB|nr:malto-oligosyltrehalose trehalohydrolase [Xinfangfangia sp. LG-4]MDR5654705.1 malto-oligosyltrehalose trehalohydrolase [Xinfangfangia sp. LG-4]
MRFGAAITGGGTAFRLWAPKCRRVQLRIRGRAPLTMDRDDAGWHRAEAAVGAGARYSFVLPDGRAIPDPAARFQPEGLCGDSEVIDPAAYRWRTDWAGRPWEEAVIYEIHPGAFTPEGTWAAAMGRLDHLAALGVTAIQLMPLAQCFGGFNWGYDGALWFAPAAAHGRPEALKAFVDAAHARGIMVFLDVVYNHFGPVGNPLPDLAPIFGRHHSPWGAAINFDGEGSAVVREFVLDNALCWLTEYNLDGLRLDAVHAIRDDSNTHILDLLAARLRAAVRRPVHLIVENSDNGARWLRRDARLRPVHFTAQWNDDLHHVLHVAATGETGGYYADFAEGTPGVDKLGRALAEGFAFQGEMKPHEGMRRGEPSAGLPPTAFVTYMQNHDQIGNRVHGDRIDALAPPAAVEAFAAVCLLSPQIPMIFMGEEFRASAPFPFFADMPEGMRDATLKGRRKELEKTPEPHDPAKPDPEETPDPTDRRTFLAATLDWAEAEAGPGAERLALYRALLDLRRHEIVPRLAGIGGFAADHARFGGNALRVTWRMGDGARLRLYLNLSAKAQGGVPAVEGRRIWQRGSVEGEGMGPWSVLWTIEV